MELDRFKQNLKKADFNDIFGQDHVKQGLKSALLMNRNIILVGPPGVGKTTLARSVAKLIDETELNDCPYHCSPGNIVCPECLSKKEKGEKIKTRKVSAEQLFVRVQGSPDLTAEDLIGDIDPVKAMKFGPLSLEAFTPGKIFKANNGVLFFDELNRCSEKLQNALLQVLEEKKVTIGSYNVDLKAEFIFIGTMNPEDTSTEPLSDVFLDRFDMLYMGYPETLEIESCIVRGKDKGVAEFPQELLDFVIRFIRELRTDPNVEKKPSVRASIGVFERAQSTAHLKGREKVVMEDVDDVIVSVLSHRIRLKPSVKYLKSSEDYLREVFNKFVDEFGKQCL